MALVLRSMRLVGHATWNCTLAFWAADRLFLESRCLLNNKESKEDFE